MNTLILLILVFQAPQEPTLTVSPEDIPAVKAWLKTNLEVIRSVDKLPKSTTAAKRQSLYVQRINPKVQALIKEHRVGKERLEQGIRVAVTTGTLGTPDELSAAKRIVVLWDAENAAQERARETLIFQQDMIAAIAREQAARSAGSQSSRTYSAIEFGKAIRSGVSKPVTEADIAVTACGAETKDGKPCRRMVAGGGRCYQHR
jgi:hypothetical protein